jgi:uncharacterized protein (DUF2235 family)
MGKNIAVFLDGTWNKPEADRHTNVYRMFTMAAGCPAGEQVCHYVAGIGTDRGKFHEFNYLRSQARISQEFDGRAARTTRHVLGGIAGYGIAGKIQEAYAFLIKHYDKAAGDRVYLFGFSRGAFAARSLAGFIDEVGILMADHIHLVPQAYEIYRSGKGRAALASFLGTVVAGPVALGDDPIQVYMIGVWDTVGALGLPAPFEKIAFNTDHHQTLELPMNVTYARHALALHELRPAFEPAPWIASHPHQKLKQVWFSGAHADVGGGYQGSALSHPPLLWMAQQAQDLGLTLDYRAADLSANMMEDIHHEVRGAFKPFGARIRHGIRQMMKANPGKAWQNHQVHLSALRRLDWILPKRTPYKFNREVNVVLAEIDKLTLPLAIKCALTTDSFVDFVGSGSHHAEHVANFIALATNLDGVDLSNDDSLKEHVESLRKSILLLALCQDLQELTCLANIFISLLRQMADAQSGQQARQHCRSLIQALQDMLESLPSGALRSRIEWAKLDRLLPACADRKSPRRTSI